MSRLAGKFAWAGLARLAAVAALLTLRPGPAWAQAPAQLRHLVRLAPGQQPLAAVLAELSRQSGLGFSYSSSRIGVARRCVVPPGPARPLGTVLAELLATADIAYGWLDGQLVLWPGPAAPPAGVVVLSPPSPAPIRLAAATQPGSRQLPARANTASANNYRKPGARAASASGATSGETGLAISRAVSTLPLSGSSGSFASPASPARSGNDGAAAITPNIAAVGPRASSTSWSPKQWRDAASGNTVLRRHQPAPIAPTIVRIDEQRGRPAPSRAGQAARTAHGFLTATAQSQPLASHPVPGAGAAIWPLPPPEEVTLAALKPLLISVTGGIVPVDGRASLPGPPRLAQLPAELAAAPATASKPHNGPGGLTRLAAHAYFHGEAWVSGTLPVNGLVKLGVPRAYLVFGAATGPFDRRTGVAWGVGLGTTGPAWGRFSTSLDLLQWALPTDGDDGITHARLFQLRPVLSYALKDGGRLQLVGGPTLSLATARRTSQRIHWDFTDNRWNWLEASDDGTLLRLWPGVQVGLRF